MSKTYYVPFVQTSTGTLEIVANSKEEAIAIAKKGDWKDADLGVSDTDTELLYQETSE